MEVIKYAFSLFLFALYFYLFASRYIRKYRQGGVINTNHEEKPMNITPPGPIIFFLLRCLIPGCELFYNLLNF